MHLKMSHTEVYNLPVRYRSWYVDRLVKHYKDKNESHKTTSDKTSISQNNQKGFDQFQEMINNKFD